MEIPPDTRTSHSDKLVHGDNFSDTPGRMAILHYKVRFANPGRFYVWLRAFSTGSEDNGVHVGVEKHRWAWDSRQRTPEVHTGVPFKLFLELDTPGDHEIMFSSSARTASKWISSCSPTAGTINRRDWAPSLRAPLGQPLVPCQSSAHSNSNDP